MIRAFWNPFYEIFSRPYWGRIWTQQELFLARDLLFHLPWGTLHPRELIAFDLAAGSYGLVSGLFASKTEEKDRFQHYLHMPRLFGSLYDGFALTITNKETSDKHFSNCLLNLFLESRDLKSSDAMLMDWSEGTGALRK